MPRVNGKLLLKAAVVVALLSVGVFAVHAFQVGRQSGGLLERARATAEAEDHLEAVALYRQYLGLVGEDVEVRVEFGDYLDRLRQYAEAHRIYGQAVEAAPEELDYVRRLAESALKIGEPEQTRTIAEETLLAAAPEEPSYLAIAARADLALRDVDRAVERLEAAVATGVAEAEVHETLAAVVARVRGDVAGGIGVLDELVAARPEDAAAYLARGKFLLQIASGRLAPPADPANPGAPVADARPDRPATGRVDARERAADDADRAVDLAPEDLDAIRLGLDAARLAGRRDRLAELAGRAVELAPTETAFRRTYAETLVRAGEADAAVATLRAGIETDPDARAELAWPLVAILLDAGRRDEARGVVDEFPEDARPAALATFVEGRVAAAERRWDEAIELLGSLRGQLAGRPRFAKAAAYQLAFCYREVGDDGRRIDALRRVLEIDPADSGARRELAFARLAAGRLGVAVDELRQIAATGRADGRTLLTLAKFETLTRFAREADDRRWEPVLEILDPLERTARAALAAAEEDDDARRAAVDRVLVEIALLRTEVALARGEKESARSTLSAAAAEFPDSQRLAVARPLYLERLRDFAAADRLFVEAVERYGPSSACREARAVALLERAARQSEPPPADDVIRLAVPPDDWDEDRSLALDAAFIPLLVQAGRPDAALAAARRVAAARPEDLDTRMYLIEHAAADGDLDRLRTLGDEADAIAPGGPVALYAAALAESLAEDADPASAQARLAAVAEQRPFWSSVPAVAAGLHLRTGDRDAARAKYLEAFRLGERDPDAVAELLLLLTEADRFAEADAVLDRYRNDRGPVSVELRRIAAVVRAAPDRLVPASAAEGPDGGPADSVPDALRGGHRRALLGDADGAEAAYRRALELKPADRHARLNLIRFLAAEGREDDAVARLETWAAEDAEASLLAAGYALLGRPDRATELVIDTRPGTAEPLDRTLAALRLAGGAAAVETYLNRRLAVADDPEVIRLLQRGLALVIADGTDPARFSRARDLIEANRLPDASGETPLADRHAKAVVLARWATTRVEALESFAALAADGYRLTAEDRAIVARLRVETGDAAGGIDAFRQLLAEGQPLPADAALRFAEALADTGEHEDARRHVDRLRLADVDPSELAVLACEIEYHSGRHATLLTALERGTGPIGGNLPVDGRTTMLARFAEDAKTRGLTNLETLYRAAGLRVGATVWTEGGALSPAQADFLAREGRIDEALVRLDAAVGKLSPASFLVAVERVLAAETLDDPGLVRLEAIVARALEEAGGRDLHAAIAAAQLAERRGQFGLALSRYRLAADIAPGNPVVSNNLAVLLALSGRDPEEAIVRVDRAIAVAGPHPAFLDTRGVALITAGRAREALPYLQRAAASGSLPVAKFHIAWALTDLEATTPARDMFAEAVADGVTVERVHRLERDKYFELETLYGSREF